jgi:hypothetical protein
VELMQLEMFVAVVEGGSVRGAAKRVFPPSRPSASRWAWGDVLLLSVQLYFFVYLRQLCGKLKSDDPG